MAAKQIAGRLENGDTTSAYRTAHPILRAMFLTVADIIRHSPDSDWDLGVGTGLEKGGKRLFKQ